MRVEVPQCKRCCCVLPLRYGLIFWGYIKLVTFSAAIILLLFPLILRRVSENGRPWLLSWISILTVDVIFTILFLVAAHKKNSKLLKVYYFFSMVENGGLVLLLIMNIVWMVWVLLVEGFSILAFLYPLVILMTCIVIAIVAQTYIILLLRSEILKLKAQSQFKFVNNVAESDAACSYVKGLVDSEKTDFDNMTDIEIY